MVSFKNLEELSGWPTCCWEEDIDAKGLLCFVFADRPISFIKNKPTSSFLHGLILSCLIVMVLVTQYGFSYLSNSPIPVFLAKNSKFFLWQRNFLPSAALIANERVFAIIFKKDCNELSDRTWKETAKIHWNKNLKMTDISSETHITWTSPTLVRLKNLRVPTPSKILIKLSSWSIMKALMDRKLLYVTFTSCPPTVSFFPLYFTSLFAKKTSLVRFPGLRMSSELMGAVHYFKP